MTRECAVVFVRPPGLMVTEGNAQLKFAPRRKLVAGVPPAPAASRRPAEGI